MENSRTFSLTFTKDTDNYVSRIVKQGKKIGTSVETPRGDKNALHAHVDMIKESLFEQLTVIDNKIK